MPAGTIITMMESETLCPRGWISGWLVTLLAGVAISEFWGRVTFAIRQDLFQRDLHGALYHLLFIPVAFVTPIGIGVAVFVLLFAAPAITIYYVLLRLIKSVFRPTLLNRVATGLLLGAAAIVFLNIPWSREAAVPFDRPGVHPDILFGFDIVELAIELSAVTLAVVAHPRWFGRP